LALTLDTDRLEREIPRDSRIAVDTSAAIAYLHGGEPASPAASWVFDGCFATGRNPGVISALTVAELLVGPAKAGDAAMATLEGFFRFFSDLHMAPFDGATARVAARVRASTGLALPDAAVVATALAHDAPIVITNDARWPGALRGSSLPVAVCLLADYAGIGHERA
jgi:predicted nucleic acid-binding protein